ASHSPRSDEPDRTVLIEYWHIPGSAGPRPYVVWMEERSLSYKGSLLLPCFLESAQKCTFGSSCFHQPSFTFPIGKASAGLSTGVGVPHQPWVRFQIQCGMDISVFVGTFTAIDMPTDVAVVAEDAKAFGISSCF